jgi:hypothetical protein
MILTKEQEVAYRETLRNAMGDAFGIALHALVTSDFEKAKSRLVDSTSEEFPEVQGEARAYRQILKYLKERPVTTPKV